MFFEILYTNLSMITPARPVRTNATMSVKIRTDQVRTPSLVLRLKGKEVVTQIIIIERYIPIMNNSDWAKLPYLWTLQVRVSPMAIARYVEDQVRVPVH